MTKLSTRSLTAENLRFDIMEWALERFRREIPVGPVARRLRNL